jgi:hypothetical protein
MNINSGLRVCLLVAPLIFGITVFSSAEVIVKTFHDANNNGTFDLDESLITGLSVIGIDILGNEYSFSDDGNGTFKLSPVPSRMRIQITGYDPTLRQGIAGPTSVFFADDGDVFHIPVLKEFSQNTSQTLILVPCFEKGSAANKTDSPALVAFPYDVDGVAQVYGGTAPNPRMDATIAQIGSTWGMAYQSQYKRAFASTILKRHVDLGPEGPGGIYIADYRQNLEKPEISSINLEGFHPAVGPPIEFGAINRTIVDGEITELQPYTLTSIEDLSKRASYDIDAFDKVGQLSYGDCDVTEDEKHLWLVNAYQRSLISLDVSKSEISLTASALKHYPIDELPGIPSVDFRYIRCINTGGNNNYQGAESFTDPEGTAWDRNKYSIDGTPSYKLFTVANTMNASDKTSMPELYHTWRKGRNFSYEIPVPKEETYTVILHFAEPNNYVTGDRIFDVIAEGETMLDNFDVVAQAGANHKAMTVSFTVEVTGPSLKLDFKAEFGGKVREAFVNGIEIIGQSMVKSGNLRPWGLDFHNGRGYLGLVNDASFTQSRDHLMGYVVSFDPSNPESGVHEEVNFSLAYPRERSSNANAIDPQALRTAAWMPWVETWEQTHIPLDDQLSFTGGLLCAYPQPIISEINFTEDGSMIISLMDRWAHQTGYMNYSTILDEKTLIIGYASGDILKAFKEDNTYILEKENNDDGLFYNNTDGPSYQGEFFYQDEYQSKDVAHHGELITGGAAIMPGSREVVTTVHNPIETTLEHFTFNGVFTQGVHFYSTESGQKNRAYLFVDQFNIGKANGLGDIEFAHGASTGEVGNYVWCDANGNGVQDPAEFGLSGIELVLHDRENSLQVVGSVMSNDTGHYVFQHLLPNHCYEIRINLSQLKTLGFSGLTAPVNNAGNSLIDSDGDPGLLPGFAVARFCTDAQARNMHDLDFGFLGPQALDAFKSECEDLMTGCATFMLSDLAECVDTTGVNVVRFYPTFNAADSMFNEITAMTINVCDGDTILYARVNIEGDTSCFSIAQVHLQEISGETMQAFMTTVCPGSDFDAEAYLQSQGFTGTSAQLFSDPGFMTAIMNPIPSSSLPVTIFFTDQAGTLACMSSGSITIDTIPEARVDAGQAIEGCGLNCIDLTTLGASFNANGSGAVSAIWTSSGSGTFVDDNTFAGARFYCPDTMDMLNGSVILTLSVIDDPCGKTIEDTVSLRIYTSLPRFIHDGSPDTIDCIHPFVDNQVNYDTFPRCKLVINCGDTIVARVIDYQIVLGDCDDIVKIIIRNQKVSYNKMEYFCKDTIYVRGLDFDNFVCPPERDSVYCHTGYLRDENGHPSPYETGIPMAGDVPLWPQPNSKCEVRILYFDEVFNGDCPKTIHRTWWIKDACGGREDTCEQWIMIFDTIGPTLTKDSSYLNLAPEGAFPDIDHPVIIVPTSTHDCVAHSYIPAIYASDTCSDVKLVKAMIPGVATVNMTYNPSTMQWESHQQVKIPHSEAPVPLIYEAFDFCHNITRDTCYFYVKDLTRPVTICDKGINVTLSDSIVWLKAEVFNEGSWDNCGISLLLARRSDWATTCGVNLCDSIIPYCVTEHHDTLWCSVLEKDKHLNPIEAYYAEVLQWLCEDGQECNALVIGGWWYDLIRQATLSCIDHPYPVDEQYLLQILTDPSLECITESLYVGDLCTKLGYDIVNNLPELPAPLLTKSFNTQFDIVKQIGGGWSKEVPFCCADACQEVTVELLAMDYWCNWSTCWTTVYVEDKTPPKVVSDLYDVSMTCTSYKKFYEEAVLKAQMGDFVELDSLLGGYDKVKYDQYHKLPEKTSFEYYTVLCDSVLVEKDSLVYDEHLGYQWIMYHQYEAIYDTIVRKHYRGQIADDCGLICLEEKPWISLDHCGNGFIRRTFKFVGQCQSESSGHRIDTLTKYQTIWIRSDCQVSKSMFTLPGDLVLYDCGLQYDAAGSGNAAGAAHPDHTGWPEYIFADDCRQIGIGYYDKVFRIVGGTEGCYKVVRTWCLADWCSLGTYLGKSQWWFAPEYQGKYLTWTQKILLIDTIAPVCQTDLPDVIEAGGCYYDLNTVVILQDNCDVIDYGWELLDKEDNRVAQGTGQTAGQSTNAVIIKVDDLTPGHYTFRMTVADVCQNESVCEKDFEIGSKKKPTPVCLSSLTLELTPMDMNADGQIDTAMGTIWASEFDQSSSAPCGSLTSDLRFRLDRVSDGEPALPEDDHLTFGCHDVGVEALRLYVLDATGAWDFCEVSLTIQNNSGGCTGGAMGRISGIITNELERIVHEVDVTLTNPDGAMIAGKRVSGDYGFDLVLGSKAYLTPFKDTDHLNGVSTRDLIDIQRHLLGKERLDSWYRRQAADANADGDITVADIVQLRKLILGMIDELPDNTSWRFFDKDTHQEQYLINPMRDIMRIDFMGVKIGDVNLDSDPARKSARSGHPLKLAMPDLELEAGNTYSVAVRSRDFKSIAGFQFTLEFDPGQLQIEGIGPGDVNACRTAVFNLNHLKDGWLTSSWFDEETVLVTLPENTELFQLKLTALANASLSDVLHITSRRTTSEAYDDSGKNREIALTFERQPDRTTSFELYQNVPNPFGDQTIIGFTIPEASHTILTIYDVTGRPVKKIEGNLSKGYHEWTLGRTDLPSEGILYYQLETGQYAAVKKMILMAR